MKNKPSKKELLENLERIGNYLDDNDIDYLPMGATSVSRKIKNYFGADLHPIIESNLTYILNHPNYLDDKQGVTLVNKLLERSKLVDTTNATKYELTTDTINIEGKTLHRIKALIDIRDVVRTGELGGYIEKGSNLSQDGECWVHNNALVFGNAKISGNVQVEDSSIVCDNATISGDVEIEGCSKIFGNVKISGDVRIKNGWVYDNATISGDVNIGCEYDDNSVNKIYGNTLIHGEEELWIGHKTEIFGNTKITKDTYIKGCIISTDEMLDGGSLNYVKMGRDALIK